MKPAIILILLLLIQTVVNAEYGYLVVIEKNNKVNVIKTEDTTLVKKLFYNNFKMDFNPHTLSKRNPFMEHRTMMKTFYVEMKEVKRKRNGKKCYRKIKQNSLSKM